ncbi:MAG: hypothetical protein CML14_01730 [Puniceicoccaceae bacterium]|nr:hypothetical protein [Puniceicoccaceae bacterium]
MHKEKISFLEFKDFTQALTSKASEIANESFNGMFKFWNKEDGTLVTSVDLQIERLLREEILKQYPDHSIHGEEEENYIGISQYCWILDPLDGTMNFSSGIPFYGVLVGLCYGEKIIYGSYRLPSYNNIFCAGDGSILSNTGFSLKERSVSDWKSRIVLTTDESRIQNSRFSNHWKELKDLGPYVRTWGDCFGYHLLISGNADVMIDLSLKMCDILPILPVIESAGLKVVKLSPDGISDILVCRAELEKELNSIFRE